MIGPCWRGRGVWDAVDVGTEPDGTTEVSLDGYGDGPLESGPVPDSDTGEVPGGAVPEGELLDS